MGFEVLVDSKNASSTSEVKLLCFDWFDEDCCSKIEEFMVKTMSKDTDGRGAKK